MTMPRRPFLVLLAVLLVACGSGAPDREPSGSTPAFGQAPPPPALVPAPGDADSQPPPVALEDPPLAGHAGLRFDCRTDSDCAVMNVGNCCGHYPACVNTASTPDPDAVASECAERGMAGICGFPVIESCACVANRCEARGPAQAAGVAGGLALPEGGADQP